MLNVNIVCIGKIKEKSLSELINEYSKRISKYCKLNIYELDDEKIASFPTPQEEEIIRDKEAKKIVDKIDKIGKTHVILLDLHGKQYTSEEFSKKIEDISIYDGSSITFVIGGTLGFSKNFLKMYDDKISFSKMTFPHQLFRLFLLEQIFRAFKILSNETYHH